MKHRTYSNNQDYLLTFRGADFFCQPGDITILPTLMDQTFEKLELNIFTKLVSQNVSNTLFVDIGANIGIYSILASKILDDSSKVFAFEPDPVNIRRLNMNIERNSLQNITVVPKAVAHDGKVKFTFSKYGAVSQISDLTSDTSVLIDSIKLDSYFKDQKLDEKFLIFKIDVEGFEPTVIRGSLQMIQMYKPTLFIELDFSEKRLQLDHFGEEIELLFKIYQFSYLVEGTKIRRIYYINWSEITKVASLRTIIFSLTEVN